MFFKGSRYQNVDTNTIADATGRTVRYKKTRFIVQPAIASQHVVAQSDRIDLLAYQYLRDSQQFWRVCDANYALWPPDLLSVSGRRIDIPDAQD